MKMFRTLLAVAGWIFGTLPAGADIAGSEAGYLYLSPVPDAPYVSAQTRYILVRFESVTPLEGTNLTSFITVTGANSGPNSGATQVAGDGRTVIFEMSQNFSNSELVTVTLNPQLHPAATGTVDPYQYQFAVTAPMPGSLSPLGTGQPAAASEPGPRLLPAGDSAESFARAAATGPAIQPNGVAVPSGFPFLDITINDNPDPGYIFIDNRRSGNDSYNVIFDNQGNPVWYVQTDDERRDMKVQRNGMLTMLARDGGMRFVGLDTNYVQTTEYWAANGYETDEHEMVVLEDGGYLLIGLRFNTVDMSQYVPGGQVNASVGETIIQEFTAADELIFQWRAWDHYDIRNNQINWPTDSNIRFPHINAIELDLDGHLLVSSRHQNEVTKMNRDTGEVIWRLNGANSDFTFVGDAFNGFTSQHAVRTTGTNRYLLFDNGNLHSPAESRAVEYELDLTNMTATVVWEFRDSPPRFSWYMGNTQRLPNGNTLINWALGGYPKLTEVRPDGTKAFEMNWADGSEAYRTWRHPWHGVALQPYLMVEPAADNITLVFNQFGDTDISHYRIYGGTEPAPTNLVGTSTVPLKHLTNVVNGVRNYWRVAAVNGQGEEGLPSNEESLVVNIVPPGQNMIVNGDFLAGQDGWIWQLQGSGSATWQVESGVSHFVIGYGGTQIYDVQLRQDSIPLTQGEEYVFEFDAWADQPRILEAKVAQDSSPYINYSGIQPFTITPVHTHYRFPFTMNHPTDFDARVVFNAGISSADVYLDNVSLVQVLYAPGDFDRDGCVGFDDLKTLADHWLEQGTLVQDLNSDGRVDFADFAVFGENWSGDGVCP